MVRGAIAGLTALAAAPGMAATTATAGFSPASLYAEAMSTPNTPASGVWAFTGTPNGTGVVAAVESENAGTRVAGRYTGDFGRLRLTVDATAVPQGAVAPGDRRDGNQYPPSNFGWLMANDYIRVDAPVAGPLFATARVKLDGSFITERGDGTAFVQATSRIFGRYANSNVFGVFGRSLMQLDAAGNSYSTAYDGWNNPVASFGGTFDVRLPFTAAGAYNLFSFDVMCISVNLTPPPASAGRALCDIGLTWGGITRVTDRSGREVTGWSVASSSGFDYAAAFTAPTMTPPVEVPVSFVPEPASWALLIAGFGLTGAALRRRRGLTAAA